MAGGDLRVTVDNRIPVFTGDDFDNADIIVEGDAPGTIMLKVTTHDRELCAVSVGAEEVAHLIRLLATELIRTTPLQGFVP